ncbi:unnamed protein product [Paramecium sonneborni]|uniref:Uncharacterized protein n=1 Tax=Paramecium sonneborni TaxID=65129 RepID=A0A8S1KQE4_9CILI|nr:unnamed protein product [Paramecium sonneborni]
MNYQIESIEQNQLSDQQLQLIKQKISMKHRKLINQ